MSIFTRAASSLLVASLLAQMAGANALARPHPGLRSMQFRSAKAPSVARLSLDDGRVALISRNGFVTVLKKNGQMELSRWFPQNVIPTHAAGTADFDSDVETFKSYLAHVSKVNASRPYAPQSFLVVFRDGVSAQSDHTSVSAKTLASAIKPSYTNDTGVNSTFARLGVSKMDRLFAHVDRSRLSAMSVTARQATGHPLLNIANAYRVELTHGSVTDAIALMRKLSNVAYASPDWTVTTLAPPARALPASVARRLQTADVGRIRESSRMRRALSSAMSANAAVPSNFSVVSSFQSMLDSSGVDAMAAYAEITTTFHQLPGAGETITNVSLGDTYAAEDGAGPERPNDACWHNYHGAGPITHMINGQRYIDYPGMPLIPVYAADSSGNIDPHYVSCGEGDPAEINLDFSMMAPLPDELQRPQERASSRIGDLLGIAPGASYRLVVPATNAGSTGTFVSLTAGAFLGAAMQNPKPDVITASLGFGYDGYGFPGRYLEDDPLMQSVVATIVNSMNIVVCISANDGMRAYTPTALGTYGGSAPTNQVTDATQTTKLSDLFLSTIPSADVDSGAIDVGGSTLNDIFSRPPADPHYAQFANQLAYPETRYNGGQSFSSGFGSRVNISAPSDNVIALSRPYSYAAYDVVDAYSEGGTSASAPEVAAGAAVALQVARLTGHPFTSARAVRDFLVNTATPVAQPALADTPLNVGPQLNVRRAVETLLTNAGVTLQPQVSRVAIAQRQPYDPFDSTFFSATDPGEINLKGIDHGFGYDGSGLNAWITIAPDWIGIPDNSQYRLSIAGHDDRVLTTSRFARLQPSAILAAAYPGTPLASSANRKVRLTYASLAGRRIVAQTTFEMTFGPTDGTSSIGYAPSVPAVVTGSSFQVGYDITHLRGMSNPLLVISDPGRFTPAAGWVIHLPYAQPLTSPNGSVTVPVSALQGAGLYGAAILSVDPVTGNQNVSDFTIFRVQDSANVQRPAAPLLQKSGDYGTAAHVLETSLGDSVTVTWDARSVPNATAAYLEVSSPGPTVGYLLNTFNNPNGSIPDNNGIDTGSVKLVPLSGLSGTATYTQAQLGLQNGMLQQVRIIPVNGSSPVGESSDVSSIISDGQRNSIDGDVTFSDQTFEGGFAIDPQGRYGVMFPFRPIPAGYEARLDYFDLKTHADQPVNIDPIVLYGPGAPYTNGSIYANDSVLFGETSSNNDLHNSQYVLASQLSAGGASGQLLSFPSQTFAVAQMAQSPGAANIAMLTFDTTQPFGPGAVPQLMSMDVNTGVMSGPFALPFVSFDFFGQQLFFGADASLKKAVFLTGPADWTGNSPMNLSLVDMQTGATTTTQSIAMGITSALAIDDTTHIAMTNSVADDSLVLYDLQRGTQQKVALPNAQQLIANGDSGGWTPFTPQFIAADRVNHLFLVAVKLPANVLSYDYNSTPSLYVYDERGNYIKTVTGLNLPTSGFVWNFTSYLQADGNARKAYLANGSQLQILDY